MLCQELMTQNPTCCTPADTAMRAAKLMKIQDVGAIPVCSSRESRRLVGIITDRDLCLEVVAEGQEPGDTFVERCMTRNPITCRSDEDVDSALHRMEAHQIRRIPVVDSEGMLVGIISQADIATRTNSEEMTAALVEEVSRPS
jgi:CBS domain-containing protein